uniref:Uncharacterized protein n=1 Tax=Romanomermis culicivorax TaxID=13658 RepID=A0A915JEQ7_ROMCU
MDANPLNGPFLDKPIHSSINQHFQYFPLDQDLFHNNAYKVYHLHFVLGLLAWISTPKRGGIFVRHMENNLRIFTVEAERVRLHNIFYENIIDEKISRPMITPNEFYSIKKIAQNLNPGMSELVTIENYVYSLEKLQEKDDQAVAILKLLDFNDLRMFQILRMPPEERLGNNLPELNSPHEPGLASLIGSKRKKFSMTHLKEIAKYMYSTGPLEHIPQSGPIGRAAYMQGSFFKSINEYYTTLRKSPLPVISYNDGSFSMCLPSIVEPDHYTMLNFGPKNQAAHRLLFGLKNEDLLIHELHQVLNNNCKYQHQLLLWKKQQKSMILNNIARTT